MAFDLATAKPVEQPPAASGGFDLSTAKPVSAPAAPVDPSIPKPTVDLHRPKSEVEAEFARLEAAKEKNRSMGERVSDMASGAMGGALTNMAAVPALGGVGKGLSFFGKVPNMGKVGDVGRALSATGEVMKAQGPKALATEGAVLGATQESVVDFIQEKYKVSREAAENWANGLMLTPAALGAGSKLLPKTATQQAKEVVEKLFGGMSGKITEAQQSDLFRKVAEKFGGGTTKEATAPLSQAIKAATERQAGEVSAKGEAKGASMAKGQANIEQMLEQNIPARKQAVRDTHLGKEQTLSDLADAARSGVIPQANAAQQARQAAGRQGWQDVEQEAAQKRSGGLYINDEPAAQNGVSYLNSLIEPGPDGVRKIPEISPIYNKLKNWRDRLMGQLVDTGLTKPEKPASPMNFRNLIQEIQASGGIDPSELRELGALTKERPGLFKKGGMSADKLLEFAQEKGWLTETEITEMERSKPGGAAERVKEMVRDAIGGERMPHPSQASDYYSHGSSMKDWNDQMKAYTNAQAQAPRRTPMEDFDNLRREAKEAANPDSKGYSAVLANEARKVEEFAKNAMEQYLPGKANQRLFEYRDAAAAEDEFKTAFAKMLTETNPNDPQQMKTAAHNVTDRIFAGRDPAAAFKRMLGGDQSKFDAVGLGHVHSVTADMDAAGAEKWWNSRATKDWKDELSAGARKKVEAYIADMKAVDKMEAKASGRVKELAGAQAALPKETAAKVAEIQKQMLGANKPVDHIRDLILTKKNNEPEMRAIYQAVAQTPGGKEAFQSAVKSILRESAEGSGAKDLLKTFDERVADILVSSGTHSPAEVAKLHELVSSVDEIAKAGVLSHEERQEAIRKVTDREFKKQTAWGVLMAGVFSGGMGAGAATGNHAMTGVSSAMMGAEAFGYISHGGYQRNFNRVNSAMNEIIADPELMKAALAPAAGYQRFASMLAQKMRKGVGLSIPQQAIGLKNGSGTETQGY